MIPRWLEDAHDPEGSYEGGSSEERSVLRADFLSAMEGSDGYQEWSEAYDLGRPFRRFTDRLRFQVNVWASGDFDDWVDNRLAWAKSHPGVGFPETTKNN